jgi:hypothetical protein
VGGGNRQLGNANQADFSGDDLAAEVFFVDFNVEWGYPFSDEVPPILESRPHWFVVGPKHHGHDHAFEQLGSLQARQSRLST